MSIYSEAVKLMNPKDIDNHRSDLYLRVTAESKQLVDKYEFKKHVSVFKSNIDGNKWYDIPFAYEPFWDKGE